MFATSDKKSASRQPVSADGDKSGGKPAPPTNPLWQSLALSSGGLQAKLAVSQPDDPYEQEADRLANQVMRMAIPEAGSSPTDRPSLNVQRKCDGCEEEEESLQRSSDGERREAESPAPSVVQETLKAGGRPLDPASRTFFEPRFGRDFGSVRIHTDERADESARAIRANAYTVGDHIAFRAGQYSPHSEASLTLLAHELTHVVQQGAATGPARTDHAPESPTRALVGDHSLSTSVSSPLAPNNGKSHAAHSSPNGASQANGNSTIRGIGRKVVPEESREVRLDREQSESILPTIRRSWSLGLPAVAAMVQRSPGPDDPKTKTASAVIKYEQGDVAAQIWQDQGLMAFSLGGEPWVTVRWAPGKTTIPNVKMISNSLPLEIGIEVDAPYDITVTVSTNVEQAYASRMLGGAAFSHKYTARGHGVAINKHLPEGKLVLGTFAPSVDQITVYPGRDPEFTIEGLPIEPAPSIKMQPFWWEFERVEQLDLMAAAHPQFYWLGLHPQEGKMRALNYTEEALYEPLDRFRQDPEVAGSVFKFYENGKAWTDLDPLYYLFFQNQAFARSGAPGDSEECIIFTHGKQSYGRKSLSHDEALRAWLELESYATTNGPDRMAELDVDGLGMFNELSVEGKTFLRSIDLDYFRLRDAFIANVNLRQQDAGSDWHALFENDPGMWSHYASQALDRDEAFLDPELASVIDRDPDFVSEAGERIYDRVEEYANGTARSAVAGVMMGVAEFLDDNKLRSMALGFSFWEPSERSRLLTFMGLETDFADTTSTVLSDVENAQMVAMGESVSGVSLETLYAGVKKHHDALQETIYQLDDANVLTIEGEFGNAIRDETYKHFGFDLPAHEYPHDYGLETRSLLGRQPVAGTSWFGSEAAFLFASEAAARARSERNWKIIKIVAVVAASVALVIVSAGVGLAVAGVAISAETAGAAFIAFTIEVTVSSVIVTAVGPGLSTFIMSGGSLDPALYKKAYSGIGWQFLMNVATFGFFKGLTVGIEAAAIAGAGGKAAYAESAAWQSVNTVSRISISGTAMFGISMVTHRLESGKWPEGESLTEILFETGLSILLLEVGSSLTRPSMLKLQEWARTQRLGADLVVEMKSLRADTTTLNKAAAKFGADPLGKKETGLELLAKQETLLNRQKAVLEELNKSFRNRPDAKALEGQMAPELAEINARLAEIHGIVVFSRADVRPAAVGGTGDVAEYTYKRGKEKVLKDYFGEKNVIEVAGHLEVMVGGPQGKKLIFRPATDTAAGILPDGTRSPDALLAWRKDAVSRIRNVLAEAEALAAHDEVLREVATTDPSSMDVAALRTFEKLLARAEKRLADLKLKHGTVTPISIERGSSSLETWRVNLVIERDNLLNRARLLGMENDPLVAKMSKMPMGRSADPAKTKSPLSEKTIKNYRDAIEQVQKLLTQGRTDKLTALDQATAGPPTDIAALQTKLGERRADVMRRAKLFGTTGSKYILDVKSLAVGGAKKMSTLSGSEEIIARAEAKLDALAIKALDNAVTLHGADVVAEVRAGAGIEKLTDAQVGDVMRQLGPRNKLSAEALRGALLASYAPEAITPISIKKLVSLSRSTAELEFMLTSFGMCRDAQVGGTFRLLRDGVAGGDKWVGTVWQMKLARMVIGIDNIRSFEVPQTTGSGNRVIDILLLDGRTVEAKDWATWLPDKVQEQFFKDLEINTKNGTDPAGLEKIRWYFKEPPPASIDDIRNTMRAALEDLIVKKGLSKTQADALRDAFNAHKSLVEAPKLGLPTAKPGVPTPTRPFDTPILPPPKKDDEE